ETPVAAFGSARAAAAAALALRAGLTALSDRLRIALHSGDARVRADGRYVGPAVRTGARLAEIANGGQTLVSATAAAALAEGPPPGSSLVDLGLHRLRDLSAPTRVFELGPSDGRAAPAPLRSLAAVPNNLPVQVTGFVGRRAELGAVGELLRAHRLVTL